MLKAKNIMMEDVISVEKDTPIYEALRLLAEHNISGVPVVEDDMTLVGVLSERDILSLFNTSKDAENKTVNNFMSQSVISFDEEEDLQAVCDCLEYNFIRRVPVTSNGKLVGIISRRDIVKNILQTKNKSAIAGPK